MSSPGEPRIARHRCLWIALGAVFLFLALPRVIRGLSEGAFANIGPDHSTDFYFEHTLQLPQGSDRFRNLLRALPPGQPMAIYVLEDDDTCSFVALLFAYLSWPHPVSIIYVGPAGQPPTAPQDVTAFYIGLAPPRPGIIFGSLVHVVTSPSR